MEIVIRQEEDRDVNRVHQLIKSAFETAEWTDHDEHHLVARLRKSDAFVPELSLVAELEGEIVGHILFTKIRIGEHVALALAPVAVLPKEQGKGIGSKLIFKGHEIAKRLGYPASILLGHPKYYPRFGYVPASKHGIEAPFECPEESFMVAELTDGGLNGIEGKVKYASEFFMR